MTSIEKERTKPHDLAVAIYKVPRREPEAKLINFISGLIERSGELGFRKPKVLIGVHYRAGGDYINEMRATLEREFGPQANLIVSQRGLHPYDSGEIYPLLLQLASKEANYVLEIDSGGGHKISDFKKVLGVLNDYPASFGSRFMPNPDSRNYYPWYRQGASLLVTVLSNRFLGTSLYDAASGYEAFSSHVLERLFDLVPPEHWVSSRLGPLHMYQTEMRAYITWLGVPYKEVPIKYGEGKRPKVLPASYFLKVPRALWEIARMRPLFRREAEKDLN